MAPTLWRGGLFVLEVASSAKQAGDDVDDDRPDDHVPHAALGDIRETSSGIVENAFRPYCNPVFGATLAPGANGPDDHALGAYGPLALSASHTCGFFLVLVAVEEVGFIAGDQNGVGDGHELGSAFAAELG